MRVVVDGNRVVDVRPGDSVTFEWSDKHMYFPQIPDLGDRVEAYAERIYTGWVVWVADKLTVYQRENLSACVVYDGDWWVATAVDKVLDLPCAGPFENLEAAKAAAAVMEG